ncbi:MAG: glutamate racemase [Bacteroidales bacterium]|nr:glutamate racemase [Bacteroidales bacterium]
MKLLSSQPIGIFDSGVGGLTVAHAIRQLLPQESIIYFGDTAHLPYGDKSAKSIIYYSRKIAGFLMEKKCKTILVACNTASAVAFNDLKNFFSEQVQLVNVIDPVTEYIGKSNYKKIGVIGTKGTINSGAYEKVLKSNNPELDVISMATPLFVPMIEEGFIYDDISNAIIRAYLSDKSMKSVETLILGCTHYPIIKNQITKFFNFNIDVIDSGKIIAEFVKNLLTENNLLNTGKSQKDQFYISDFTLFFEKIAKMFFEETIDLKKIDFWN